MTAYRPTTLRARGCVIVAAMLVAGCEGPESGRSSIDADSAAPAAPSDPLPQGPGTDSPRSADADLRAALQRLLRGPADPPGAEETPTWFSAETADALRSVSVDSTGHATVDFHDLRGLIPNASSSAGSALLVDELNATVFGVPGVRSVEYRMGGSCDRFWEWLQYECHTVTRD